MRIKCWYCHKNCTNELPKSTVFRAIAICPECNDKLPEDIHDKMYELIKSDKEG